MFQRAAGARRPLIKAVIMPLQLPDFLAKSSHTLEDRADFLSRSRWIDNLDWKQCQEIARYSEICLAPRGAIIFQEGDSEAYLALILTGKVEVRKSDSKHKDKPIGYIGPGKTVGEMSLLDGEPRSATVVANEDSYLLVLGAEEYNLLAERHPALALKIATRIAKSLSQRLRQTSGRLIDKLST